MIWGSVETLTGILLPFCVRTTLIHILSMEYVGLGGLFSSILQLLSLTELGLANAITQSLYRPLAEDDKASACALLKFYRSAYRVIGLVILLGGLACMPFLDRLVKGECPADVSLQLVFLVYLVNSAVSYFAFADKKTLLIAMQRNDVTNKVAALVKAAGSLTQIVLLLTVRSYYVYVIFLPLMTLADNLLCAWRARRMFPEFVCRGSIQKEQRAGIIQKTKGLLFHRLCNNTRNTFDNLFISALFGLATVGAYNNYLYILTSVRGMLDVLTRSLSAGVGNSVAVESVERNYHNLRVLTFLYEWLCGWCTVCLLCLYQPFMELWVGPEGMFQMEVVVALCIYFYVWTMGDIKSQFADARGIWWKNRYRTGMEALCNIVLNWVMIRLWGVTGVVLATAVSILFLGFPWSTVILFKDYFHGKSVWRYFGTQLLYAAVTVGVCVLTWLICSAVPLSGVPGLAVRAILCCIVPNAAYLLCYGKTQVFRDMMPYARRLLRRG